MTICDKIIRGEVPCYRVYEDASVLAFLDIGPIARGHTLVIPKVAAATLGDLSDDAAAALGRALPRLCRAVQQATGCIAYNLLQNNGAAAGQVVMHAHVHIIPRYEGDGLGSGLQFSWRAGTLDSADGANLAMRISERVK